MTTNEQRRPARGGAADSHSTKSTHSSSTDGGGRQQSRMVKVCSVWERTSARGSRYLSGFWGDCQVVGFFKGEKQHPTRPDETVLVWEIFLQEKDPARRPGGGR